MAMSVSARVKTLERRCGLAAGASCPKCGGKGWPAIITARSEEHEGWTHGGCPACGKSWCSMKVILPPRPGENPATDPWHTM